MSGRLRDVLLYGSAAVLGALLGLLSHDALGRSLRVPLYYKGDALFYGAAFKGTVVNGWYEYNPFLNAPIGQTQHDFPQADNAQYAFAKAMDLFTDDWAVAFNVTYLLTFPLAAMAAVWFLRLVGCSRFTALALSLLFAVAPYHYFHGISHLALSQYYVLPLGVGLAFLAYHDRAVWSRRPGRAWYHPLAWATWRNAGVLAVLVLLGSTSSYYAVFTLLLFATTVVVLLLRRRVSVALNAVATVVVLTAVMLLNMLPDLWYARHTSNLAGFQRSPLESELYAVKLSSLVLPTPWNRIGGLGQWRLEHDATFPLPSEPTALGVVASVGFLVLLLLPAVRLALHGRTSTAPPASSRTPRGPDEGDVVADTGQALGSLAVFNLVAFLFATVGGLATLFAVLVTPAIRTWARLAILIALLALAAVGLLVDAGVRRWLAPRTDRVAARLRPAVTAVPAALVLAIGLFDQMPSDAWTTTGTEAEEFASDAAYGAAVQDVVPADGIVMQMPWMAFPESEPILDITDYDPLRGYLHTDDVRWTYGGVKGSVRSAWTERLMARPLPEMVAGAAAAGVSGIHVDRFGYPERDPVELEDGLTDLLGPPTVVSDDDRFAFYSLDAVRDRLERTVRPAVLQDVRRRVVQSPGLVWPPDFLNPTLEGPVLVGRATSTTPDLQLDNPTSGPVPVRLSFNVRSEEAETDHRIAITWPDGEREEVVAPPFEGAPVERTFDLEPGPSTLGFSTGEGVSITLISPALHQVELDRDLARLAEGLRPAR